MKNTEIGYQDQMNSMSHKISDLTNKLWASERRLKRYERRKCKYAKKIHMSMEYLQKYGNQLSIFQGHELYKILSCGMEKYGFSNSHYWYIDIIFYVYKEIDNHWRL